jgi:uncharacterized protein
VASAVPDGEKMGALEVLSEHLFPGRWADLRAPKKKELAATLILRIPLDEWSVKVSEGYGEDDPDDLDSPVWAGVVPLRMVADAPEDAPDLAAPTPPPSYLPQPGGG